MPDAGEFDIVAGGTKIRVHVQPLDADQSYPPPPTTL